MITIAAMLLVPACTSNDSADNATRTDPSSSIEVPSSSSEASTTQGAPVSKVCAAAFQIAAAVNEFQATHADLFAAFSACTTLDEWVDADALYPDAIDGVDPVLYATNVCISYPEEIGATAICQATAALE
jgi:hypothetical protein